MLFKELQQYHFHITVVGTEGFEPPKSKDGRFTVCSRWPLVECARFKSRKRKKQPRNLISRITFFFFSL